MGDTTVPKAASADFPVELRIRVI